MELLIARRLRTAAAGRPFSDNAKRTLKPLGSQTAPEFGALAATFAPLVFKEWETIRRWGWLDLGLGFVGALIMALSIN